MMASAVMKQEDFPSEDIAGAIYALIRRYPPLAQSRHYFTFSVVEGVVTLEGNIKSAIAERVLLDNVPHMPGVVKVIADNLTNDEDLRHQIGQIVPAGVLVNIDFGVVALGGSLPARRKPEALVNKVAKIKGVVRVINKLA